MPWPFARLAELWGGRGVVAATLGELRAALREAWHEPRFTLIEVPLRQGRHLAGAEPLRRGLQGARLLMSGPAAWADAKRVFEGALDLPEDDRAAFVDSACARQPRAAP